VCQISSRLAEQCKRKVLQFFYTLQYYGVPGGLPGPKFTNLGTDVQQGPDYHYAKFAPCDNLSARYLLPNFIDFVGGVTTKKQIVNDMSQHTMWQQKDSILLVNFNQANILSTNIFINPVTNSKAEH